MSNGNIINKYDFSVLMAGALRLINEPALISKYQEFLLVDYFFHNDDNPKPKALRFILKTIVDINSVSKTKDINLISFGPYLRQNAENSKLKQPELTEINNIFAEMKQNQEVEEKSNNAIIFKMFLDYLKLIQIAKLSESILKDYKSGKPDSAAIEMNKTLNNINQITISEAKQFDPSTIYSRLKNPNIHTKKLLKMGSIKLDLDGRLGGFRQKTLNLFVGLTNTGKSQMAYHLIRRCVESTMKVHITIVEDTEETFVERIVACLADMTIERVKDPLLWTNEEELKIKKVEKQITDYVTVDFVYGQSIDIVHKRKLDHDLKCDLLGITKPIVDIVDYTGHIAGKSFGDKKFEKMISAYTARKDFALEHDKIVFDFAQVNREGGKKSVMEKSGVLTINELAGAFDISHVCDTIISINRNELDERNNTTRIHVCKSRNGNKGGVYLYGVDFSKSRHNFDDEKWMDGTRSGSTTTINNQKEEEKKYVKSQEE